MQGTHLICKLLMRPSMSRCPAEYCSMTSFTSYGRSVSLNFLLATRNFRILQPQHTHGYHSCKMPEKRTPTHGSLVNLWKNAWEGRYPTLQPVVWITRLIKASMTLSFTNRPIKEAVRSLVNHADILGGGERLSETFPYQYLLFQQLAHFRR